jgi:hypothetical protein
VGGQRAGVSLRYAGPGDGDVGYDPVRQRVHRHDQLRDRRQWLPSSKRCCGPSPELDNFQRATVWSGRKRTSSRARGGIDKGQRHQVEAFVTAVRTGAPMPIPLDSLAATTRATIAVGESLASGRQEPA